LSDTHAFFELEEKLMETTHLLRASAMLAAALAAMPVAVHGQAYPAKPIRFVIPFSPGGAADVPGRIIGQRLSKSLGQQVIADNRPGAGGGIGAEAVAKSPPDGYTLLMISNTHVISRSLYKKQNYDLFKDLSPLMQIGAAPNVLVVHPSLPARNVKQLVALAKSRPGAIDYASSGNGSAQHLFAALFTSLAGVKMTHVPYKGSAQATTDLIAGHIQVSVPGINNVLAHVKAGRLRALGLTGAQRSDELPDVPTIAEAGVPGYEAILWLGIMTPAGTPRDIVARLNGEITRILQQPDVRKSFKDIGTDAVATDPEKFGAYIRSEFAKWAKVVKETGVQAN
jgi:tripartite-type tricarboxylate transporter receptor subunit TctC